MIRPALLALAAVVAIGQPTTFAGTRTEKVYAANGRRVAVIRSSNFGRRVYGENGRRVAVIRSR